MQERTLQGRGSLGEGIAARRSRTTPEPPAARRRERGASMAEALVVTGAVALAGLGAASAFGSSVNQKIVCFGDELVHGTTDTCGAEAKMYGLVPPPESSAAALSAAPGKLTAPAASSSAVASNAGTFPPEIPVNERAEASIIYEPWMNRVAGLDGHHVDPDTRRANAFKHALTCSFTMQLQSTQAHRGGDVCGYHLLTEQSNDVMQVWVRYDPESHVREVQIVFRGSRTDFAAHTPGDWWNNAKAELLVPHVNQFTGQPAPGRVGKGWQDRWRNQLTRPATPHGVPLRDLLNRWAHENAELNITISGHSQGAADATVAGYDVAQWMHSARRPGHVTVLAFNSPKPGNPAYAQAYRNMINTGKLQFYDFSRNGDPVSSVPVSAPPLYQFSHILTNRRTNAPPISPLHYCAAYASNSVSWVNPVANHSLDAWSNELPHMSQSQALCMSNGWNMAPLVGAHKADARHSALY